MPGDDLPNELSEEEAFYAEMADVKPLDKGRKQTNSAQTELTPGHIQRQADAVNVRKDVADPNYLTLSEVPGVEPLLYLEWKKDGVQNAVFNKLKRDGYGVEASLDLHRKTVKEARELLFTFLSTASAKSQRCVLLSPGKGEFSKTPGRLKSYVATWLIAHTEVIAYCSAERHHGGVGSVYVLVRKSDVSRELNREVHG
ncbi:MAG: DNA-nicking Smr family endonuclease, partial [Candidatus Azotimanducaceae bacterium]